MGKASPIPTSATRARRHQNNLKDLEALHRSRNTPKPVATTAFSGSGAGGSSGGTGNYLNPSGGTMVGPLALGPPLDFTIDIDANQTINLAPGTTSEQYTSNIQLDDIQANGYVLDTIQGAAFDGQLLVLRTFAPSQTFTISAATLANAGNIQTPDSNDVTGIGDLQMIVFIFDEALKIEANTGGSWRLLNTFGSGGGGVSFPITPPIINLGNRNTDYDFSLSATTGHVLKLTLTGDINLTFSGYAAANVNQQWIIKVTQDATGGRVITWPAEVVNPPNASTYATADSTTIIVFDCDDNGTVVRVGNTVTTTAGVSALSGLTIDVNKGWGALGISNLGALTGVTGIDLDGASATIQGVQTLDFFQAGHSIVSTSGVLTYNVADIDNHVFAANNVSIAQFEESAAGVYRLDMLDHAIENAKDIGFDVGASYAGSGGVPVIGYDTTDGELLYNVPDTAKHVWTENNVELMGLTASQLTFADGLIIQANPGLSNAGINVGSITPDPTSTTNGNMWYNSTSNTFKGIVNGVAVNFVTGTGTGFANDTLDNLTTTAINVALLPGVTDTIDLGSELLAFRIVHAREYEFINNASVPSGTTDTQISKNASGNMAFNNDTNGGGYLWYFEGVNSWIMTLSSLTGSNIILNQSLVFNSSGLNPTANGEFRRNGNVMALQAEEFDLRNTTTVATEYSELSLTKVDADPLLNEDIGRLNFGIDDSGTIVNYAGVYAQIKEVTDAGSLLLIARSNNGSNSIGIQIDGDNDIVRTYATFNSIVKSDFKFGNEDGAGGTFIIAPDVNAGASTKLGVVVQDNVGFTTGTSGTLAMPSHTTTVPPTAAELNGDFGTHEGAMGFSRPTTTTNDAGKLFIRNSDGAWFMFSSVLRIT